MLAALEENKVQLIFQTLFSVKCLIWIAQVAQARW
jgi:hypothetical protein